MQGKLIAVAYTLRIETSSLWADFVNKVNKKRCIIVCLVSEENKALNYEKFDNKYNSFL